MPAIASFLVCETDNDVLDRGSKLSSAFFPDRPDSPDPWSLPHWFLEIALGCVSYSPLQPDHATWSGVRSGPLDALRWSSAACYCRCCLRAAHSSRSCTLVSVDRRAQKRLEARMQHTRSGAFWHLRHGQCDYREGWLDSGRSVGLQPDRSIRCVLLYRRYPRQRRPQAEALLIIILWYDTPVDPHHPV